MTNLEKIIAFGESYKKQKQKQKQKQKNSYEFLEIDEMELVRQKMELLEVVHKCTI